MCYGFDQDSSSFTNTNVSLARKNMYNAFKNKYDK